MNFVGKMQRFYNAVKYGIYTYHRALVDDGFPKVTRLFTAVPVTLNGSHFNVKFVECYLLILARVYPQTPIKIYTFYFYNRCVYIRKPTRINKSYFNTVSTVNSKKPKHVAESCNS